MKTEELANCPFCGGKAHFIERDIALWDIGCDAAGCYLVDGADWYLSTRDEAAERWNTRTRPSPWTPIEQGSPTSYGWYLVTTDKSGTPEVMEAKWTELSSFLERCVTAWMPLPEPYKGDVLDTEGV